MRNTTPVTAVAGAFGVAVAVSVNVPGAAAMVPAGGEDIDTVGGIAAYSVVLEVVCPTIPKSSVAFAVTRYVPLATPFQASAHVPFAAVPDVSAAVPGMSTPPLKNCTFATAAAGELAFTEADSVNEAGAGWLLPDAGEAMVTVGGSATVNNVDPVLFAVPRLSVALAVMLWMPAGIAFH